MRRPSPRSARPTQQLILEIVEEIQASGVTGEELAKAKKISLSHHLATLTTMRGQASDLGSNWFLTRNLNFTRDYLAARAGGHERGRPARRGEISDAREPHRHLAEPERRARRRRATPPRATGAGEIQKIELSNGLRLLVREDARLPLVSMTAVFRGGLLAETRETNGITQLMAKTLLKGTKTRTAEQIADTIEAVGGQIGSDSGNNSFSVSRRYHAARSQARHRTARGRAAERDDAGEGGRA